MILKLTLNYYLRKLKFINVLIWTYNPLIVNLINKLQYSLLVYHCVDKLSAIPNTPSDLIDSQEKKLFKMANIIFTSSIPLTEDAKIYAPNKTFYFPNVADFKHFSNYKFNQKISEVFLDIPKPRIGFML